MKPVCCIKGWYVIESSSSRCLAKNVDSTKNTSIFERREGETKINCINKIASSSKVESNMNVSKI